MAQQTLNRGSGTPGDGSGESLFSATPKINDNFTELYGLVSAPQTVTSRTASGTLVIGEANAIVEVNTASASTITIPPNSSVAYPVGTIIEILQVGAGVVTAAAGAGVTLNGTVATAGQWKSVFLRKRATDTWIAQ